MGRLHIVRQENPELMTLATFNMKLYTVVVLLVYYAYILIALKKVELYISSMISFCCYCSSCRENFEFLPGQYYFFSIF